LGINGIKIPRLGQVQLVAGAEPLPLGSRSAPLPSYTSSISRRSCHKPYLLRRNRSQSACAKCAVELSLRGTIPSAKFLRRLIGPNNANEFLARQSPLPPGPLFSSRGGKRFGARFATTRSPQPIARRVRAS